MEHDLKIIAHIEVQLLDFGESRTAGKYIKLRLPDMDNEGNDSLDPFRGMDTPTLKRSGHIMNLTLSEGDIIPAEEPPEKGEYGKEASKLYQSGFFRAPAVWKALGTDEQYREWIQKQNCMCCGNQDWDEQIGEGRCEAGHVRRSGEAGTSFKSEYACVPLTRNCHAEQHQKGELAAYIISLKTKGKLDEDNLPNLQEAQEWFDSGRIYYLEKWCKETLRSTLGYNSLTQIPPAVLLEWATIKGIEQYLPTIYKG